MSKDKKEDQKQVDEDEDKPNKEVFLEKEQRDPDEAMFAEQAIRHYANDVIDMFRDEIESAMSELEAFLMSHNDKQEFNNGMFLESLGGAFLDKAMDLFGGADSPAGKAVYGTLESQVDQAVRGGQAGAFTQELSMALRDAGWYLRDNIDMILSNEWDELLDLAYEVNTDFIPALHAYGLPAIDFQRTELSKPMIDVSQQYLDAIPKEREENIEQDQIAQFEEQEAKLEEPEVQNLVMEEEEKK